MKTDSNPRNTELRFLSRVKALHWGSSAFDVRRFLTLTSVSDFCV